ncbi:MAG TPA: type II toxin-antitoxin system RelE/ParE family toxin [Stenotrophomonas sp.]|nr:type II toxin-antitoxin system RelE/ParE family toxin [Stenotrophomonas sp.]
MSSASTHVDTGATPRNERWQRWIAALVSALLHLLLLLLLLFASKPTVTTPQAASGGGRMKMDFVGRPTQAPPSPRPPQPPAPAKRRAATSQVRTTLVEQAVDPVPPPDETPTTDSIPTTSAQDDWSQALTQAPPASPPAARQPTQWSGRPPGSIDHETAAEDAGTSNTPSLNPGNRNGFAASGASLDVGGYQVIYDLSSQTQLRIWQAQGMKELSIPLPGTRYRMVCALEIALRRGSGKCRLLEPYSPEMKAIGDAREVMNIVQVYKQGELVWHGPGPYR